MITQYDFQIKDGWYRAQPFLWLCVDETQKFLGSKSQRLLVSVSAKRFAGARKVSPAELKDGETEANRIGRFKFYLVLWTRQALENDGINTRKPFWVKLEAK